MCRDGQLKSDPSGWAEPSPSVPTKFETIINLSESEMINCGIPDIRDRVLTQMANWLENFLSFAILLFIVCHSANYTSNALSFKL